MVKDYYSILNINRKAKPAQIKKAYRGAAKEHHPDISPQDEEKFKEIQEAYETLSDPERRAAYDRQEPETPVSLSRRYRSFGPVDFPYNLFDEIDRLFADPGDFWISNTRDFWRAREESRRNRPVEIVLTLEEARRGCRRSLRVPFRVNCTRCRGTGRVGGLICGLCRGQGEEKMEKNIRVDIPAGARDGMEMRIPLKDPDLKGADLLVTLIRVSSY
jgi:molecular chaperone DnaJ